MVQKSAVIGAARAGVRFTAPTAVAFRMAEQQDPPLLPIARARIRSVHASLPEFHRSRVHVAYR